MFTAYLPGSLEQSFRERFGGTPRLYRAPGRVNLIGELEAHRDELPDEVYRRGRHVVAENARVATAVAARAARDLARLGELLHASHESLREDYAVSCPELDLLVDTAMEQPGVHGSRMMGGGFGGSTISLVDPGAVESLGERYRQAYGQRSRGSASATAPTARSATARRRKPSARTSARKARGRA